MSAIPRKRIGKDISFNWTIFTDNKAESLEGRDIKVFLRSPSGISSELKTTISNNVVSFKMPGVDQSEIGVYGVTLWENKGKEGQNALDKEGIVELVSSTEQE